ncbi:hypothetical protein Xcom_16880 [Xanthomonas axonopodis pv. commiphoreae]|nr:hypothetical protein Xcom_16880 [Xanthomonas axonopodis pv. commiphoreae]
MDVMPPWIHGGGRADPARARCDEVGTSAQDESHAPDLPPPARASALAKRQACVIGASTAPMLVSRA